MSIAFHQILAAGAQSLADGEYWCVMHPDGPLLQTASRRLDLPILVFCDANKIDWDEARAQGFHLGKVHCNFGDTLDAAMDAKLAARTKLAARSAPASSENEG